MQKRKRIDVAVSAPAPPAVDKAVISHCHSSGFKNTARFTSITGEESLRNYLRLVGTPGIHP